MSNDQLRRVNEELKGQGYQLAHMGAGYQVTNEDGEELFFAASWVEALLEIGRRQAR
jgi:hypothetical protein